MARRVLRRAWAQQCAQAYPTNSRTARRLSRRDARAGRSVALPAQPGRAALFPVSRQCRARNDANLRLTPPCSRELQVFGLVGHGEERAAVAAAILLAI